MLLEISCGVILVPTAVWLPCSAIFEDFLEIDCTVGDFLLKDNTLTWSVAWCCWKKSASQRSSCPFSLSCRTKGSSAVLFIFFLHRIGLRGAAVSDCTGSGRNKVNYFFQLCRTDKQNLYLVEKLWKQRVCMQNQGLTVQIWEQSHFEWLVKIEKSFKWILSCFWKALAIFSYSEES